MENNFIIRFLYYMLRTIVSVIVALILVAIIYIFMYYFIKSGLSDIVQNLIPGLDNIKK